MRQSSVLHLDHAVPLVYAWCAERARSSGIRALAIKGPFLAQLGLRPPKISGDVDVLVHPDDLPGFLPVLAVEGWSPLADDTVEYPTEMHSITLVHEYWPCSLDLHRFWQGYLAEPGAVFDELWAGSVELSVAGSMTVRTPGFVDSALMYVLNELRSAPRPLLPHIVAATAERLRAELGDRAGAELFARAKRLGAEYSADILLAELGVELAPPETPSERLIEWRLWTLGEASHTARWMHHLSTSPWYRKPIVLLRALAVTPSQLRAFRPDMQPGIRSYVSVWWARLRKGARLVIASRKRRRDAV